jgi:hypothetical protein
VQGYLKRPLEARNRPLESGAMTFRYAIVRRCRVGKDVSIGEEEESSQVMLIE